MKVIKKHCKRCDKDKLLSEFDVDNSKKDRLTFYCRDCISEYSKIWLDKNKEYKTKYIIDWENEKYKSDIEFREKRKKSSSEQYYKNRDKVLLGLKLKYENDEEFRKNENKRKRIWEKKNPEKVYILNKRKFVRRKRHLGFNIVQDNPFDKSEKVDWHHMDDDWVIAILKDLHQHYGGKNHRDLLIPIVRQIYGDDIDIWKKN